MYPSAKHLGLWNNEGQINSSEINIVIVETSLG